MTLWHASYELRNQLRLMRPTAAAKMLRAEVGGLRSGLDMSG
jgi:hypothetical protein